jgi:hypothetical protein
MKNVLAGVLVFFTCACCFKSWGYEPVRFDHLVSIDIREKNMKFSGDYDCLSLAKTFIPKESFVKKLATDVSSCDATKVIATAYTAMCTQPYIMNGLYDFRSGKFSVSAAFMPPTDLRNRVILRVRNGQVGVSSATFEVRVIAKDTWVKWINDEKKAAVQVPYLCNITLPSEIIFK